MINPVLKKLKWPMLMIHQHACMVSSLVCNMRSYSHLIGISFKMLSAQHIMLLMGPTWDNRDRLHGGVSFWQIKIGADGKTVCHM